MITFGVGAVAGLVVGLIVGAKGGAGIEAKLEAGFAQLTQTVQQRIAAVEAALKSKV